jgi:hypothetical protein
MAAGAVGWSVIVTTGTGSSFLQEDSITAQATVARAANVKNLSIILFF